MKQPYVLDSDGLDGISDKDSDPAAVKNTAMPVGSYDAATFNGDDIVNAAGLSNSVRAIAVLIAVGLTGLVIVMAFRTDESDVESRTASIRSHVGPSETLSGRDLEPTIDRPNPVLASRRAGTNGSVRVLESADLYDEVGLKPSVKAESDSSTTSGPIQNPNSLDIKQPTLKEELQVQAETSNEEKFGSRSGQLGETLSENASSTPEKVAHAGMSTGVAGDITSSGAFKVGEFLLPFGFNKTVIKDLSESARQGLYDLAEGCPHTIRVVGHTCNTGSLLSNQAVALMRAVFVKDLLVEQGFAADRIEVISAGEKNPIASNKTRAGRVLNRRVVVSCSAHTS